MSKISMRILHRYLGFFLVGVMTMYALSGIVLIFRNTDFLKQEKHVEKTLEPNLNADAVGKEMHARGFKFDKTEGDIAYFKNGTYNVSSGEIVYDTKELPVIMDKMTKLHKATTDSPVYWLNIFFGLSLLFFVVSTFWMFKPKTGIFKKGLVYTAAGMVLVIVLLFV